MRKYDECAIKKGGIKLLPRERRLEQKYSIVRLCLISVLQLLLIKTFMSINCWLSKTEHGNPFADNLFSSEKIAVIQGYRYLGRVEKGALGDSYAHRESLYNRESTIHHPSGKDALWAVLQRLSR
jgi:hypothetical protein